MRSTKCTKRERGTWPLTARSPNLRTSSLSVVAVVSAMPTGVLISCATPATSWPERGELLGLDQVGLRLRAARRARCRPDPWRARSACSRRPISVTKKFAARAMSPSSSVAPGVDDRSGERICGQLAHVLLQAVERARDRARHEERRVRSRAAGRWWRRASGSCARSRRCESASLGEHVVERARALDHGGRGRVHVGDHVVLVAQAGDRGRAAAPATARARRSSRSGSAARSADASTVADSFPLSSRMAAAAAGSRLARASAVRWPSFSVSIAMFWVACSVSFACTE